MMSSWLAWVCSLGDGSRVPLSHVADDETVSWREPRVRADELFGRTKQSSEARGHWSGLAANDLLHSSAGNPDLIEVQGGSGTVRRVRLMLEYSHLGMCSSADRRFRKLEDVVMDSFGCNCEDHITRRDESDITAVELAAVRATE